MSDTLNAKEDVEILADKDPGVGLPGRVYLPDIAERWALRVIYLPNGSVCSP